MPTSKFRIFKILILAGAAWLVVIILLHFQWEDLIESENDFERGYKRQNLNDFFLNAKMEKTRRQEMLQAREKSKETERSEAAEMRFEINENIKRIQQLIADRRKAIPVEDKIDDTEGEKIVEENLVQISINPKSPSNEFVVINDPMSYENSSLVMPTKKFSYTDVITTIPLEVISQLGLGSDRGERGAGINLYNVSPEIQAKVSAGWEAHQFNEFVSDLISVNRTVPDPRSNYCHMQEYTQNLPKTSVIIIFHNEAWSTLLRTVHSVLNRSPPHLIEEVILVDDFSNMPHLREALEDYMSHFPKVKIVRAPERVGLIKARIIGTNAAKGPTLTFLDSHVECCPGWLEPLLDRIARDPSTVVCPVIDVIDDGSLYFSYQNENGLQVGGFKWQLTFIWVPIPEREVKRKKFPGEPTRSPTMAGGLFSIDKAFFEKLGMYDPGFDIWGAENLEISFKTWMCGGTLEIIPCSHVGHIFRKKSPYIWRPGVNVLKKNTVRLAEVWLDDYKKFYYLQSGFDKGDYGDISERIQLRKELNCKSFQWYIENIYPELEIPDNIAEGYVKNNVSNYCLDFPFVTGNAKTKLLIYSCHYLGGNQFLEYRKSNQIHRNDRCLEYTPADELVFTFCNSQISQVWTYNVSTSQIYHAATSKCISYKLNAFLRPEAPIMETCDPNNEKQRWNFEYLHEEKLSEIS